MKEQKEQQSVWYQVLEKLIKAKIFPQVVHRLLVWGKEPGTGKSSWGHYQFGEGKVERIVMHPEVLPDDLLYCVELVSKNGATETIRRDGPVLRALRQGKVLVIDEIDKRSPAMESLLHAVNDDMSIAGVTLPDGERVKPTKGFAVIATSNQLPNALGHALLDRFDIILQATEPHPGALMEIGDKSVRQSVVNYYNRVEKAEWKGDMTMRRAMAYDKIKPAGQELAAMCSFGDLWKDQLNAIAVAGK